VASWRDSISAEASAEVDAMLNAALPFAQQMLEKHGEFYPYAVKRDPELGDKPVSTEVLAVLYDGLSKQRESLRATAVVSDVRISSPAGDAIRVEIEHREGAVLVALLPYSKKRFGRGVTYGDLQASTGERHTWPAT
jgi:hypothetical protein